MANQFLDQFLAQVAQGNTQPAATPQAQAMRTGVATGNVSPMELADAMNRQVSPAGRVTPGSLAQQSLNPQAQMFNQAQQPSPLALNPSTPTAGAPVNNLGSSGLIEPQPPIGGFQQPGIPRGPLQGIPSSTQTTVGSNIGGPASTSSPGNFQYPDAVPATATEAAPNLAGAATAQGESATIAALGDTPVAHLATEGAKADVALAEAGGAAGEGAATLSKAGTAFKAINSKLASLFPEAGLEISAGSLLAGAGVAMAGLTVAGIADKFNIGGENSNIDKGITGGLSGLGVGGGIALALGATGPVGLAIVGGAALFGIASSIFGNRDDPLAHKSLPDRIDYRIQRSQQVIDKMISSPEFGVDSYTAQQARSQFAAATGFYKANRDEAGLAQYLQGLGGTMPAFFMEMQQRQQALKQRMNLQAAFSPVYSQIMTQNAQANESAYQNQLNAAKSVTDPNLQSALINQASTSYKQSAALNAAYASQVAGVTTQLPPAAAQVQSAANQMAQQSLAGMQQ